MRELNSHMFQEVYNNLGINLSTLGCVMLDTELIELAIPKDYLYYSKNQDRFWIDGLVCDKKAHVTLLYGLLTSAQNLKPHITKVLDDWLYDTIEIEDIGYFDSPYKDEDYYCIIAHIKKTDNLLEGHKRLEFLPHINTFSGYRPHLTLCYIKKDVQIRDNIIKQLKDSLINKTLKVTNLNLGKSWV